MVIRRRTRSRPSAGSRRSGPIATGLWRSLSMAQASWSAPTRMVFLLHGEDPFRTRLRLGELVAALLAGGAGEPGDLAARRSPQLGGALGLTRIDARSDPVDAITM